MYLLTYWYSIRSDEDTIAGSDILWHTQYSCAVGHRRLKAMSHVTISSMSMDFNVANNRTGNSAMLYRTIRTLTGRTASKLPPVTVNDGSSLCDETVQLHRWKYHFQEQFNNPAPPLDPVLMAETDSDNPDPLKRFYPTNGRRDIGCNPKTEEKPSSRNLRYNSRATDIRRSPHHQLATSSFHTNLEIQCHPHRLEPRHNSSTLERKRPENKCRGISLLSVPAKVSHPYV